MTDIRFHEKASAEKKINCKKEGKDNIFRVRFITGHKRRKNGSVRSPVLWPNPGILGLSFPGNKNIVVQGTKRNKDA